MQRALGSAALLENIQRHRRFRAVLYNLLHLRAGLHSLHLGSALPYSLSHPGAVLHSLLHLRAVLHSLFLTPSEQR